MKKISINTQNTDAEIILGYLWATITLLLFGMRYWQQFTGNETFSFILITLTTLILGVLTSALIFNFEKIQKTVFANHNDWMLRNIIGLAGLPAIIAAWAFFVIYNVGPKVPDLFPLLLQKEPPVSAGLIWFSYILFPYLLFTSIRRFTKISIKKSTPLDFESGTAKILGFKWWQLSIALIAGTIYYYHYNSSLGFAFANTFLLSALVFDLVCYATTVSKSSGVWRKI